MSPREEKREEKGSPMIVKPIDNSWQFASVTERTHPEREGPGPGEYEIAKKAGKSF